MKEVKRPGASNVDVKKVIEVAPLSLAPAQEIKALLQLAKHAFASSEVDLRRGAENVALAVNKGATQRKAAEGVGKSAAWVNRLLKWRKAGYPSDTPFGPQSKAKRRRASVQAAKQPPAINAEPGPSCDAADAGRDPHEAVSDETNQSLWCIDAEASLHVGDGLQSSGRCTSSSSILPRALSEPARTLLIDALNILGSAQVEHRAQAALASRPNESA